MRQRWVSRDELSGMRDTVESIWVAIILAFVLRAFVVEAFRIPTGSMAPNLMGQHVLVDCPRCGVEFPHGVKESQGPAGAVVGGTAVCPNCLLPAAYNNVSYSGDRVLVLKYLYGFGAPKRWDVVVFKDPQTNDVNYIKRLAGLPGEVVRIIHGDLFVHPLSDANGDGLLDERDALGGHEGDLTGIRDWQIARKPLRTQEEMWQLVFDNDFRPVVPQDDPALRQRSGNDFPPVARPDSHWREPWQTADGSGWDIRAAVARRNRRVFRFRGDEPGTVRFAADQADCFWGSENAYNDSRMNHGRPGPEEICSDLKLQATLLPEGQTGMLRLTLSSFEHEFAGEVRFDGRVRLLHRTAGRADEDADWTAADCWGEIGLGPLSPGRAVRVALAHADWQVALWIDDQPVLTSPSEGYQPDVAALAAASAAGKVPLPRVGMTGEGGSFELWHVRVLRDVFYTDAIFRHQGPKEPDPRYAMEHFRERIAPGSPAWGSLENPLTLRAHEDRRELDEFFMLGDNSPASHDSRTWISAARTLRLEDEWGGPLYRPGTVPRYNLIGKAFFVYWPAARRVPPTRRGLPVVPNVGKMRCIR